MHIPFATEALEGILFMVPIWCQSTTRTGGKKKKKTKRKLLWVWLRNSFRKQMTVVSEWLFFYWLHATSQPPRHLPLTATTTTHITWPSDLAPLCLANSLPLFIQCFHGDWSESPQTAWTCSLSGPSWLSKSAWLHNILGIWYGYCGADQSLVAQCSRAKHSLLDIGVLLIAVRRPICWPTLLERMLKASCVYRSPSEQLPSCLLRNVATSFLARILDFNSASRNMKKISSA